MNTDFSASQAEGPGRGIVVSAPQGGEVDRPSGRDGGAAAGGMPLSTSLALSPIDQTEWVTGARRKNVAPRSPAPVGNKRAERAPGHKPIAGRSPYPVLQLKGHTRGAAPAAPLT